MLHLLLGRDWTANRDEILKRISADVQSRRGGRILMVPELISHETERRLCASAGDTASRYAEVLSFTRLARRVTETLGSAAMECLDNGGRVVAMASAARQLVSRLKAYASVETRPEFLSGLIDAVDEFKRCCITSADLSGASAETEGTLAQKLEELSLLMEGYDTLCSRGKRDPRDQMTWLLELLEDSSFGEDHVFYIDGFPDFTRQHMAILEHLIRTSKDVTVSLNCDRAESALLAFEKAGETASQLIRCAREAGVKYTVEVLEGRDTTLDRVKGALFQGGFQPGFASGVLRTFRAQTPYMECMAAAHAALELVRSGCRYRDITLVFTDPGVYLPLIRQIFNRFHIPVYQSGTEDILQKNVIATVLSALDAALNGFDRTDVMRYLRSGLSPLEPDTCDLVENYAVVWGIRGQQWMKEWVNHPDGLSGEWDDRSRDMLEKINEARSLALEPLSRLSRRFREAVCLKDQILGLYGFLEEIALGQRLLTMAQELDDSGDNRSAQILNQLWEILLSALEQMHDVLGDTHWEAEHFCRLLRLLLSQYDVGTIPPVLDAVQTGPVSAMRCHQQKHLILLGAQEGSLPGYTGSAGVLTDQERVTLRQLGVPLTGGAMEGIQAEFAEIYGVFCGATESIRVFCSGEQPSFVFRRLCDMAGGAEAVKDTLSFAPADEEEAAYFLARWQDGDAADRLGLTESFREAALHRDYALGRVEKERIEALYGHTLNLSASQIDRMAECRMSYFLKYGLRAQERKEATVDPAEFGTYVHAVLEKTCREIKEKGGFHRVSLEETMEIAHRYSDEYAAQRFSQLQSERMTYLFRRNVQELDMVVAELWQELSISDFAPEDFEVNFGGDGGLAPIAIPNHAMNALLRGFIDRVDCWHSGGSTYYRVVDYKTGKKDFDYCDVFNGVGLQMLLYMFALKHSGGQVVGERAVAAGVQYFPARAPYITADGRLEPEDAEKLRQSQWKRRGLLLQDEQVLHAMEPGEQYRRLSCTLRKDGTLSGDLADREQLKMLEGYVFRLVGKLVEDIASGNVEPNPYTRGSSHDACAWCPYGAVCHSSEAEGRRNYKAMTAQRFWEEIEKEAKHHGR
ncbi:MAG: PD-(D/E)XK nuclease family protein [Oscillospiraceae bacterium]|nr:PD-(D/E)XK nuclease family protein [Oscillospiraceae bacterium]